MRKQALRHLRRITNDEPGCSGCQRNDGPHPKLDPPEALVGEPLRAWDEMTSGPEMGGGQSG